MIWAGWHTLYLALFAVVVWIAHWTDTMRDESAFMKAVLLLGLLINLIYVLGYLLIAAVRYLVRRYARHQEEKRRQ